MVHTGSDSIHQMQEEAVKKQPPLPLSRALLPVRLLVHRMARHFDWPSALAGLRPLAGAKVSWVQQLALVASRHVLQLKWRGHRTLNRGSGSLVQTLSPELMPPHTLSAGSAGGWRSGDQVDQIARSGLYSSSMKRTRGALRG
ncbi:hypothetical protein ACCO45_010710 [Purpureocillium lilacinum]|uniref:Uncharacterized protein n=1 Tax=Purpureocillium lilacinum TaxID=33203 RepID=A0ACC4DFJ4_PURLI